MADGRDGTPQGRSNKPIGSKKALANENRLIALGDAVDRQTGVQRHGHRPRRPNRRRRRVFMALASVLALIVVIAGGAYLYANYRFDQIPKIHVASDLPQLAGKPFNILEIGSDSRAGLTGKVAIETGAAETRGQGKHV